MEYVLKKRSLRNANISLLILFSPNTVKAKNSYSERVVRTIQYVIYAI